jgi:Rieske Fe-S protein
MNQRDVRRYVEDLARGKRPKPFAADDFEAEQIRAAIDLQAARPGNDEPSDEFLGDLHRRLAAQLDDTAATPPTRKMSDPGATRRQVIIGTSAAATAAVAAVSVDRLLGRGATPGGTTPDEAGISGGELTPTVGTWQRVAASSDVSAAGMHPFDLGSVVGFVRRVDGKPEAVSGVCTHQGCKLWFDGPQDRLRCPCHSTSFSPAGAVLTHQLPISPKPLPKLDVREVDGVIEVFAPPYPTEPV